MGQATHPFQSDILNLLHYVMTRQIMVTLQTNPCVTPVQREAMV